MARAIKAVRPDIHVLGPCLYSIRIPDLKPMVQLGLFRIRAFAAGNAATLAGTPLVVLAPAVAS